MRVQSMNCQQSFEANKVVISPEIKAFFPRAYENLNALAENVRIKDAGGGDNIIKYDLAHKFRGRFVNQATFVDTMDISTTSSSFIPIFEPVKKIEVTVEKQPQTFWSKVKRFFEFAPSLTLTSPNSAKGNIVKTTEALIVFEFVCVTV